MLRLIPPFAIVSLFAVAGFAACSTTDDAGAGTIAAPTDPEVEADADVETGAAPGDATAGDARVDGALPPDPPPTAAVVAAVKSYRESLAAAICTRLASCCSDASYDIYFAQYEASPFKLTASPPRNQCATVLAETLAKRYDLYLPAVSLGRMTFDANKAQSCISGVNAAACGLPITSALYDAACFGLRGSEVFRRLGTLGASCKQLKDGTFNGDCDVGVGYCAANGTCSAWSQAGESCKIFGQFQLCAPALNCENDTPTKAGACSGPPLTRSIGQSCGATSGPLELCAPGSFCENSFCVARKNDGAACKFDDECTSSHPFTCSPVGAGTCGTKTFCSP